MPQFWTLSWRVSYLKHDVLVAGFCLCLQVEPTQVVPIEKASLCLRRQDYG
jgi:hypothetical protein